MTVTLGVDYQGVNELESSGIPLLEKGCCSTLFVSDPLPLRGCPPLQEDSSLAKSSTLLSPWYWGRAAEGGRRSLTKHLAVGRRPLFKEGNTHNRQFIHTSHRPRLQK
jgi:hypothetical protein